MIVTTSPKVGGGESSQGRKRINKIWSLTQIGKSRGGRTTPPAITAAASVVFTNAERTMIAGWFRDHTAGLPPGLEKQLRQRGTLPPGLQKKVQPLPIELEGQLRKLPGGYVRAVIGASIVLMNEKTPVIHDIIRNALP